MWGISVWAVSALRLLTTAKWNLRIFWTQRPIPGEQLLFSRTLQLLGVFRIWLATPLCVHRFGSLGFVFPQRLRFRTEVRRLAPVGAEFLHRLICIEIKQNDAIASVNCDFYQRRPSFPGSWWVSWCFLPKRFDIQRIFLNCWLRHVMSHA